MIRDRLERAARRLLREDTFQLMVVPAITDLQVESAYGRLARMRSYFAVCAAFAGALADDVVTDMTAALGALVAPAPMRHGACALIATLLLLLVPTLFFIPWTPAWPLLALLIVPSVLPVALLPALTIAAREARRQVSTARELLVFAVGLAVVLFLYVDQAVTRTNRTFRQVMANERGIEDIRHGANEMPITELLRIGADIAARDGVGHRNEFVRAPHARGAFAAACLAYALFGVALARVRLTIAVPAVVVIAIAHVGLLGSTLALSAKFPHLIGAVAWLPTIVLIAAATLIARLRSRTRTAI